MVGVLDVLLVVLAFEVLDIGGSGVGLLSAPSGPGPSPARPSPCCWWAGGWSSIVIGFACWGLALSAVALVPSEAAVPVLLGLAGAGGILTEVAGACCSSAARPTRS